MGFLDSLKRMFGGNKDKSQDLNAGMNQPGSSVPPAGTDSSTGVPTPPMGDGESAPPTGASTDPNAGANIPPAPGAGNDPTKPIQ